jgi:hypothetical protein
VVASRAEVDWLDEERGSAGWADGLVAWCIGVEAEERARERGWPRLCRVDEGIGCEALIGEIASLGPAHQERT